MMSAAHHHHDTGQFTAQADFIMEPQMSAQPVSLAFKRRLIRMVLQESFAQIGTSRYWIFWQRRSLAAVARPTSP